MKAMHEFIKAIIPTPPCFYKVREALIQTPSIDKKSTLWKKTPIKYRVMLIMLWAYTQFFENLKNVFFYTLSNSDNKYRVLNKSEKHSIVLSYRRLMGNVVTLCYDEGIDKQDYKEFGLEEMKKNIIRLFLSILYGYKSDIFILSEGYKEKVISFIKYLGLNKKEEKFVCEIISSIDLKINNSTDFLYTADSKNTDILNIPIVGALEFGRDLKDLHKKLNDMGLEEHANITIQRVLKNLLYGGYGQIHSVLQKDISSISWKSYIDIAYKKGNDLVRLDHALYGMLDDNFFTKTSCDFVSKQIFCDDVCDILEDITEGTLTAIPLFYIAQGELAKNIQPHYKNGYLQDIDTCKNYIEDSGLCTCIHEGVLMHHHPFGELAELNIANSSKDLEKIIKVILANSKEELDSKLIDLINKRASDVSIFIESWKNKDYVYCFKHIQKSKVNNRFLEGWKIYISNIKNRIIEETSYNVLDNSYKTNYYYRTMLGWYYRAKYVSPFFDRIYLLFKPLKEH